MAKKTSKLADSTTMMIDGDLVIENIEKLHADFEKEIAKAKKIILKAENPINSIDLTGVQCLNYFLEAASKGKKEVEVQFKLRTEAIEMMEKCGFVELAEKVK